MTTNHDNNPRFARAAKRVEGGLMVFVQVLPGASRAGVIGLVEDRLKISVTKKALDGAANEAVRELLADVFNLKKAAVTLLKGEKSKQKTVLLQGNADELARKLDQLVSI